MSKKNKKQDIPVRSGVLSCFNYKKKTLLQKEAYELSPMYWKCFLQGKDGNVILLGHRSEMSNKDKPRVSMVVNGCTTELLPPILKAKGKDHPGNDNYLGIQTDEDKIIFLKAEGRSQRDLWYKDIIEALGDRASATMDAMSAAPERRSPSQERPQMPSLEEEVDNDNHSLDDKASSQSDVYHVPYQDYEPMRCSVSTDEDGSSWTGTKPSSSSTTEHASSNMSDAGEEETSHSEQGDLDEDGYVFPNAVPKKTTDLHDDGVKVENASTPSSRSSPKIAALNVPILPEAKPSSPAVAAEDRPAISSDFLESLKQAQESKPRHFDSSPEKARYTAVTRRTVKPPPLPENFPKIALPNISKELKQSTLEKKTPTEESESPIKSPATKPVKTPEQLGPGRKSARKPMKMPPPLPAGGNSKPKALLGSSSERQEGLPQLPKLPQARAKPTSGEASSSSSETSPIKQPGADANDKVYQFVRSFRSTQMSRDPKAVQVPKESLQEKDSLKFSSIKDVLFISAFREGLNSSDLLVGDEVHMINDKTVSSVEEATKCIQATEGDLVTLSIKKIPHGVLSYISRSQEPSIDLKKLGLTLRGNEVTKFDSEGLVARSGIPSRQLVPGITNNGEMVNWALTQINMIPISSSITTAQVEEILSESGNTAALVFHPADFAAALAQ